MDQKKFISANLLLTIKNPNILIISLEKQIIKNRFTKLIEVKNCFICLLLDLALKFNDKYCKIYHF